MTIKKTESFIKTLVGLSFFIPLIVIPSGFIFPFILPKIVIFRSLVLLMLGGYLLLLIKEWDKYKILTTPVNIIIWLFLLSFGISTFVGVDTYKSFWDSLERMLGLFTITHFFLYYLITTSVIRSNKDWIWLFRVFLFAGAIVIFIAFLQKLNPDLLFNNKNTRVISTLGHPIYLGEYGSFLSFLSLFLLLKEEYRCWRIYAIAGIITGILGIVLSDSRGPFLGFAIGAAVLLISYIITLKEYKKLRIAFACVVLCGAISISFLFHYRQTKFVSSIPSIGRLLNTSIVNSENTRYMAWDIAFKGWQDYPIFGCGPNNFYHILNKYYNPKFLRFGYDETWFDNAHNVVANTLATQGMVGLILYLGLFGIPIFVLWRGYRKKIVDLHLAVIGTAFLVNHFVAHLFVFENPASYLYFFFLLAFINSKSTIDEKQTTGINEIGKTSYLFLSTAITIIVLLLIYFTNINTALADRKTINSIDTFYKEANIVEFYKNLKNISSPHTDDLRTQFAYTAIKTIPSLIKKGSATTAKQLFAFVYAELEKNRRLHPLDVKIHLLQAELALQQSQLTKNIMLLIKTEEILEDALGKSPKRQQVQYMLSHVKLLLQKHEEAIQLLQNSIDNDPKIDEGWWRLALVFHTIGDSTQAKKVIKTAKKQGIRFHGHGRKVIDNILTN